MAEQAPGLCQEEWYGLKLEKVPSKSLYQCGSPGRERNSWGSFLFPFPFQLFPLLPSLFHCTFSFVLPESYCPSLADKIVSKFPLHCFPEHRSKQGHRAELHSPCLFLYRIALFNPFRRPTFSLSLLKFILYREVLFRPRTLTYTDQHNPILYISPCPVLAKKPLRRLRRALQYHHITLDIRYYLCTRIVGISLHSQKSYIYI